MTSKKRVNPNNGIEAKEPPSKKHKASNVGLNNEAGAVEPKEISVTVSTKLGVSNAIFDLDDLKLMDYFRNYFSGRWNAENASCSITNADLCWSIDEIKALIIYKKFNYIYPEYPCAQLMYFCNACDYFAADIDTDAFSTYFSKCVPAIKYQDLQIMKSKCSKYTIRACIQLLNAVNITIKQISQHEKSLNQQIIEHWTQVPIELLISNEYTAANVFITNMKFVREKRVESLLFAKRTANDLRLIWKYLHERKAYKEYPDILKAIYAIKAGRMLIALSADFGEVLSDIVLDILTELMVEMSQITDIVSEFDGVSIKLILNIFDVLKKNNNHYNYLFGIVSKLAELRKVDSLRYNQCFGEHTICQLLSKAFDSLYGVKNPMNFIKDIEALNTMNTLNKKEQCDLLGVILHHHQVYANVRSLKQAEYQAILQRLIKNLVESDYDKTFQFADIWFPLMMKNNKEWIVKQLPKTLPLPTIQTLITGICKYITSTTDKKKECDPEYFEFINEYTNIQWNISQ